MLDFGSGSGILAIGAARLGAMVEAIEIDEEAILHAEENARFNSVADQIRCSRTLESVRGPFDVVVANILRPVLMEYSGELAGRLAPGGTLILSGLVATDVPEVSVRFTRLLDGRRPEVYRRDDWCALLWRPVRGRNS
jgi:ribosomal protein L11 methyltransferase